ncbi:nucleoside/nucleotide kinase family protein [Catelliglobosispora koreensis]|uniref:hypothetical protein n=1 Tax=Catelliglobosispora koreensis TaxID=129052 RepID=UPI00036D8355|nr:hypothetical protein [Catelliglobosispora koreensis]
MSTRATVLAELAELVLAAKRAHPLRVAVDGCSAAGKTTLAGELAAVLAVRTTREIIHVGLDYFKLAVEKRTAYPQATPESYYLDSWDNDAIRDRLLIPLGPQGSRHYVSAVMDLPARNPITAEVLTASEDAILLADGVFLQRPELNPFWDLRIYVDVSFGEVLRRGIARDQRWMNSAAEAEHRYRTKYIPGEKRYVAEVRPREHADIVVSNEDPAAPVLTVRA